MTPATLGRASLGWAGVVVRSWVRLYTMRLSPPARDERRAELASDLFEHVRADAAQGVHPAATAVSVAIRCVLGIPADLAWRVEVSRADRQQDGAERSTQMPRTLARDSFTGLAVLAVVLIVAAGLAALVTGEDTSDWWALMALFAAPVALGLRLRHASPLAGHLLVIAPVSAMAVIFWWTVLGPVLAALLLLAWFAQRGRADG